MSKFFYPKLAATNIKNNRKTYLPYLLTCIGTVTMFYMISSLSLNSGLKNLRGGAIVAEVLNLGTIVTGIFAVIFLFYTNSFLMKRRKKEFGLFNILGMEKKHISRVVLCETIYIILISLTVGLLLGVLLDKLLYLGLLNMLKQEATFGFEFSATAFLNTILLFVGIFLLIFLNSLRQIHLSKPIELLRGGEIGEKEPKTKWIMTILGLACLGLGYYISVMIEDPIAALMFFFVAVILVIFGTYFLFTAGSIALLKALRKNKKYYYKTKHFVSVSGMIYRMKQNAVGLANICILSTCILVMISTTLSLFLGMGDIVDDMYPRQILVSSYRDSAQVDSEVYQWTKRILDENGISPKNEIHYTGYLNFAAIESGDTFSLDDSNYYLGASNQKIRNLLFFTLDDYNKITGQDQVLGDHEVLFAHNRDAYPNDQFTLFDTTYSIKENLDDFPAKGMMASNVASSYFIVVKDADVITSLCEQQAAVYGKNSSQVKDYYAFDIADTEQDAVPFYEILLDSRTENTSYQQINCRSVEREEGFSLYGGFFFIGIFLGLLFTMATILIIYYKQISEGYDDKYRFEIMQKVGMSHSEVKKSIHSQVLTVFFLPLVTAGIHILFAFPVITRILSCFNLTNITLFAVCTLICFLVFSVLYALVYSLTAKVYYKIVS
ncbi:FtsX-like permease family protein [Solibaculum mannosilyticum]|uniref:ABC transporter permease n=1 Tax=Solibaculum mannosilyticum TaxID=2780922 RepID=A0A7I8D0T5_9FIRM|nr:FtsX-like permease family protein [Solibaculum mannosilyticum]BCI60387.1 ABC transporter permease [Solibaculum mannosilyticum]